MSTKFCNNKHIAIEWGAWGSCPLCACFLRIQHLEQALKGAASSLGALAAAGKNGSTIEDLVDVRAYANSRKETVRKQLWAENETGERERKEDDTL